MDELQLVLSKTNRKFVTLNTIFSVVISIHGKDFFPTQTMEDNILPPMSLLGEEYLGKGKCPIKKLGYFGPVRKPLPAPPNFQKNHCPCILKGQFSTNSILSAFHLQGSKSKIQGSLSLSK